MRDESLMVEIGERVRRERMRHGWNQKYLAELTGIPQGNLSRIEKGQYHSVHPSRLYILAQKLGVSLDYLFGLLEQDEEPPPRPARIRNLKMESLHG